MKVRTIIGVAVAVFGVSTGALSMGMGTAAADTVDRADVICWGLSPNIVDLPYAGRIAAYQRDATPGLPTIEITSAQPSIWGYQTNPTIRWTNLATGASGAASGSNRVGFGSTNPVFFPDLPTGAGPLRVDLTTVNVGPVPVPAVNCSGVIDIR
ncbi:hypothetical protein [Nocardia sp. NPDC005366]|uniref:hypothetical protein n=1 Tax=Nocardia sp. NPDC005366 TaxID=3156878 RepID=UPI0033B8B2D4